MCVERFELRLLQGGELFTSPIFVTRLLALDTDLPLRVRLPVDQDVDAITRDVVVATS